MYISVIFILIEAITQIHSVVHVPQFHSVNILSITRKIQGRFHHDMVFDGRKAFIYIYICIYIYIYISIIITSFFMYKYQLLDSVTD